MRPAGRRSAPGSPTSSNSPDGGASTTIAGGPAPSPGPALSAFPLALLTFVVTVTGLALGVGLLVLVPGIFVLAATALVARGLGHAQRIRMRTLLGWQAPTPPYVAPSGTKVRRFLTPLRDPQSWLDLAWGVVGLVTGTFAFVLAVTWWATALGGLSYWIWERFVPQGDDVTLASLAGLGDGRGADIALTSVIGAVAALTLPLVVRFAASLDGSVSHLLLCSRADLQHGRG